MEGGVWIEDLADEVIEVVHELFLDLGDIGNGGLADNQRWVVVVCACVLNEQQAGAHGNFTDSVLKVFCYDKGVEDGLKVVVTVVLDVGGIKDGCDIGKGFQMSVAGFVVNHSNALRTIGEGYFVNTVNDTSQSESGLIISFRKHSARGGTTSQDVFERNDQTTVGY